MYPTLYDLILDIFGLSIPPLKLVQSFGMMVAFAFIAASMTLASELKRREKLGLIPVTTRKEWRGKPSSIQERIVSALVGFLIGFKALPIVLDLDTVTADPQSFILSTEGNLLGGVLGAAISVGWRIWEDRKNALPEPKEVEVPVRPHEHVSTITMLAAIFGILGAKVFHNLENMDELMADPVGALVSFSGLSFLGGLICAGAVIIYYAKKQRIPIVQLMDSTMPGLILAYGIGRIGCQLAGDGDWGIPNDEPMPEWLSFLPEWVWRYDYPNNVLGVDLKADFARQGYVSLTGHAFPTPLYETTMALIIFAFLWSMRKRWTAIPGLMTAWYLLLTGTERLLIEQIRINNEYNIFGYGITQAEIISSVLILAGIIGILNVKRLSERITQW